MVPPQVPHRRQHRSVQREASLRFAAPGHPWSDALGAGVDPLGQVIQELHRMVEEARTVVRASRLSGGIHGRAESWWKLWTD